MKTKRKPEWERCHMRAFEMDAHRRIRAARDPKELALALALQAEIAGRVRTAPPIYGFDDGDEYFV
jgi:hypothetical protein